MSRKAGTPNKPKVTSHPMGELDTVDEPREVATQYENPIEGVLLSTNDTIKGYTVVTCFNSVALIDMVMSWIDGGYQPLGGVSVTNYRADNGSITMVYCQAMVKRE
jgi:hypothetical protein